MGEYDELMDEIMNDTDDDVTVRYPTLMKLRMKQLRLSSYGMARLLGCDPRTIYRYMEGLRTPDYNTGMTIARLLRLQPTDYDALFKEVWD